MSATKFDNVLVQLLFRPKSISELGISASVAREMESLGLVEIDPDRFPDEFVPGNPMIVRLPGDNAHWPGWKDWNL